MLDYLKKQPLVTAAIALVAGFVLGWLIMGWWLWPVEWIDSDIAHLRQDLKEDYILVVATAYDRDMDLESAAWRMNQVGGDPLKMLADLQTKTKNQDHLWRLSNLQMGLEQYYLMYPPGKKTPPAQPGFLAWVLSAWWICGIVVILAAVVGVGLWYLKMREKSEAGTPRSIAAQASRISAEAVKTDYTSPTAVAGTPTGAPPIAQFMTTYMLGDDLYDDSFSIDGPDGNFLGECGMGISETIGVGDPKKVVAFEVWLFDKNDIRTVTKVLMSEHAFKDDAIKSRLAAKGEPVLIKAGDMIALETATLVVTARVVDLAYGGGPLPPNSYFERLTIELAAFTKPSGG